MASPRSLFKSAGQNKEGERSDQKEALGDVRHKRGEKENGSKTQVDPGGSLVMVCAVIRSLDMNPTNSFNSFSLLVLI